MKTLHDLKIQNKCTDCSFRGPDFFCSLSQAALQNFQAIKMTSAYPKGARLFVEGERTVGIYMLCHGRVKLTTHSRSGRSLILRIAVPGEILGLSAAISDSPSETTAEVIESCQVNFVLKSDFCRFLEQNADAGMNALRQLSLQYKKAYTQIRSLGLSTRVADKLAMLILDWSKNQSSNNGSVLINNRFSHEEIAEMIGTSRETVTRILTDFRGRELISIKGTELFVPNVRRLEAAIGSGR